MKPLKNIYIIGIGAIGCAYASKINEMDPNILKVIADKDRIERYNKNGITINGSPYHFNFIQPDEKVETADLIIISVKHHNLRKAISDIRSFVGKDTIILSLLNGISSEEIIGKEFGMENILYSFSVGIDAVREDTHIRFSKIGKIVFGDKTNIKPYKAQVEAVKDLFDRAGIPYTIPEDMMRELWWKFMLNVGANQISAVLKATYGVFSTVEESCELMKMASKEVVLLAQKLGINLNPEDLNQYIEIFKTLDPDGKTSMLQDIEAGRKTEVEIFAGTVVELGRKYGVDTPINNMLFKMIRTLEQLNSR